MNNSDFHRLTVNSKAARIASHEARREIVNTILKIDKITFDYFVVPAFGRNIVYITTRSSYSSKELTDSFDYFSAVMSDDQSGALASSLDTALQQINRLKTEYENRLRAKNLPADVAAIEQGKINYNVAEVMDNMRQTILRHFVIYAFNNAEYEPITLEITIPPEN